jgi:hypothetical protein
MSNFVPISIDREVERWDGSKTGYVLNGDTIGQLSKECVEAIDRLGELGGHVRAVKLQPKFGREGQWLKVRLVISVPTPASGFRLSEDHVVEAELNIKHVQNPTEGVVRDEIIATVRRDASAFVEALQDTAKRWQALAA